MLYMRAEERKYFPVVSKAYATTEEHRQPGGERLEWYRITKGHVDFGIENASIAQPSTFC